MDYSYDTDYNSRGYLLNAPGVMEGQQADSGSAYSPCSYNTDASYNSLPRSGTSILKDGSLRSRGRTYESTVLRPMKHTGGGGYQNDRTYDRTDLGSQQQQHWEDGYNSTSNHYNFGESIRGNNTGRENGYYDYNNGNATRLQEEHSANTLEPLTAVTKPCLKKSNEKEEELPEDAYPAIAKPSPRYVFLIHRHSTLQLFIMIFFSLQIIATRNHPCCECVKYSDNRTPVCLLFLIFLVCSSVVITGVMYYLKSGIEYCRFCKILHFKDTLKSIDSSTIVKIPAVTNVNDLNAQSTRKSFCLLLRRNNLV